MRQIELDKKNDKNSEIIKQIADICNCKLSFTLSS